MSKSYIEEATMADWKVLMANINQECIEEISKIETSMSSLPDSFRGDYAEVYEQSFDKYIKAVKNSHESLKDFQKFLDEIVEVMKGH